MSDWQKALTDQVAANIEHYRLLRGISRTALAARCDALGLPTKRPALAAFLDQRRQTITLQEIVVLADALDVSAAELIVPLHSGQPALHGPGDAQHAVDAASQLFAVAATDRPDPYRPFLRYRRAAARFEHANHRLAQLSHALAVGDQDPNATDGRPHPASEVLATEAALARLLRARDDLDEANLLPPPLGERFHFLSEETAGLELPVLKNLPDEGASLLPLYLFRPHVDQLPTARLATA